MNNDLTTFEVMAAFKDLDIKLPMLETIACYCLDPIGGSYFEVPLNLADANHYRMVLIGQLVFKASDLANLNITYQTL
jgi:hypothetical protein